MAKTTVDIVIPVHGRLDILVDCLNSIPDACQQNDFNIFIVNDASPEGISEVKKVLEPYGLTSGHLKHFTVNQGFPKAVNTGAKIGKGKYIFLLNSDVVLNPHSLDFALGDMETDSSIGVLGFKLLFPSFDPPDPSRPGGMLQHGGISINILGRPHHLFVGWNPNNKRVMRVRTVPAVTGAALLTTRDLWRKIGGMDVAYGRGTFEDIDYCYSARVHHEKHVVVNQNAIGWHHTGASSAMLGRPFALDFNYSIFYNKWKPHLLWTDGDLL